LSTVLAIIAGDVGMGIVYLAILMAVAGAITIVGLAAVFWSTKHPEDTDSHSLAKHEKHWVIIIIVVLVAIPLSTISYLPYPYTHANVQPTVQVDVAARQFAWCLTSAPSWGTPIGNATCVPNFQIPVGRPVFFNLTSADVNHDFGVYNSGGELLFQVQVMPGFYNSVMYNFTKPGTYYVRCLEFCGYGHYGMTTTMNVTS
jgi:cytochrome c oxidase subunit II